MYQYKDKDYMPKSGDICEHETKGLFIVTHLFTFAGYGQVDIGYEKGYSYEAQYCKTLKTKPTDKVKIGDQVICTDWKGDCYTTGQTYIVGAELLKDINHKIGHWKILVLQTEEQPKGILNKPQFNESKGWWVSIGSTPDEKYLHSTGKLHSSTFVDGEYTGYFATEQEAIDASNKYLGIKEEQPMTKLSDFLKEKGVYAQFLANLDSNHHNYQAFCKDDNIHDAICDAFIWPDSPEGYAFWRNIAESIDASCINDVRAPNDTDYWEEQFQAGRKIWYVDPSDNEINGSMNIPPSMCTNFTNWYAEKPTWLTVKTEEEQMKQPIAKVGAKVICLSGCSIGNHEPGSIETITRVDGNRIWVSNTNDSLWILGSTWRLYADNIQAVDTEPSDTTSIKGASMETPEKMASIHLRNTVGKISGVSHDWKAECIMELWRRGDAYATNGPGSYRNERHLASFITYSYRVFFPDYAYTHDDYNQQQADKLNRQLSIEQGYLTDKQIDDLFMVIKENIVLSYTTGINLTYEELGVELFGSDYLTTTTSALVSTEENSMTPQELTEAVTAGVIASKAKPSKCKKEKTDLQQMKSKPWTGVIVDAQGKRVAEISAKTEDKLNTLFEDAKYRDMSMRVSEYQHTVSEDRKFKKSK